MTNEQAAPGHSALHSHLFLGESHERNERRTWAVIWLCAAMMIAEIVGGLLFGSIALVADGLHMSTHAGALLLAALAYRYARRHAEDQRFAFGTGKLGDLAGFASAIILTMIALLIAYEAVQRFFAPVPIDFAEAIPIACFGLAVNVASVFLLGAGHSHSADSHGHGHRHSHAQGDANHRPRDDRKIVATGAGTLAVEVFEDGVPPRFRLRAERGELPAATSISIETIRPDGTHQSFVFIERDGFLESRDEIPEPHEFAARLRIGEEEHRLLFEEHDHKHVHGSALRDNNMRAAIVHVMADATVTVLVIVGLVLARAFDWSWIDPLVGLVGAFVIGSWSYGLIRDASAVLLDMTPDREMEARLRNAIESDGDTIADLHLWRLGPGHLGAILSVRTHEPRDARYYQGRLARFKALSHLTVEVNRAA
jgi:cation diffusion facilitator family transporter